MRIESIKFSRPFYEKLRGRVEAYRWEVGVLEGKKIHKKPYPKSRGLKNFNAGPARYTSRTKDLTMQEVAAQARINTGINFLREPFLDKNTDAVRMLRAFFRIVVDPKNESRKKRFINLVQACVRNPILNKSYGPNSRAWQRVKGFNRKFIDTGQLFNHIKARLIRKRFRFV